MDKIIEGMELAVNDNYSCEEEKNNKIVDAWKLFGENACDFWD